MNGIGHQVIRCLKWRSKPNFSHTTDHMVGVPYRTDTEIATDCR